jgi:diketogulonate reductase-like aldo/keto reductase
MTTTALRAADIPIAVAATGASIPVIGYGTGGGGRVTAETVAAALACGYRHIDTARKYGTEPAVGAGLKAGGVPREEIFLTTKVSHENLAPADFERSTLESLETLGTDYVDLLMVHWPLPTMDLRATMAALADMKRRGLARHIGVANFNGALLEEAVRLCPEPLSALQVEFHPFLDQSRMRALCRKLGLVFISYCPLARGRVLDAPVLAEIAEAHGRTPSQVALRYLIQHEGVAAIPGSGNPERIAENLVAAGFTLTDGEMARIAALARPDSRLVSPAGRAPDWAA